VEEEKEREFPHAHLIHAVMPVVFLIIWAVDSFIFRLSPRLSAFVPLTIRLLMFLVVLVIATVFIQLSHKALFGDSHDHPNRVIDSGIMAHVRHPMYLGVLLIYVAVFLTTLSLICFFLFIGVFMVYDKMASFEEKQLEMMFGEQYLEYKKRVRKWIPG
jgi:protein-S-isoprenylcysteine O-methyltransferase Ste14